jgi:hypothetical protein
MDVNKTGATLADRSRVTILLLLPVAIASYSLLLRPTACDQALAWINAGALRCNVSSHDW